MPLGKFGSDVGATEAAGRRVDSVSTLSELVQPTSKIARVLASVSRGDLSQGMPLGVDERELLSPHIAYSRFRYSTNTSRS
jgi:hypothetical protein